MTMKKKMAITTMAASLVLGTFSGIPLSNKGIASMFGLSMGVASAATIPSGFLAKYNALHTELAKDANGIAAVRAARNSVDSITNNMVKAELVTEVWNKINTKLNVSADYNPTNDPNKNINAVNVYELVRSLAISYDSSGNDLNAAINDSDLRNIADKLAVLSNSGSNKSGVDHLTVNDFRAFYDGIIGAIEEDQSAIISAGMDFDRHKIKTAVKKAFQDHVLDLSTLNVSKVLTALGIDAADLVAVTDRFNGYVNSQIIGGGDKARSATESAVLRYVISTKSDWGYHKKSVSTDGRTLTPEFRVYQGNTPLDISGLLKWKVISDSSVSVSNGKFVLSGNSASTVKISAEVLNRLIYIGDITLEPQSTAVRGGIPGIGGGGAPAIATPTEPIDIGKVVSGAKEVLNDLKEKIKDATPEKKIELIAQAQAILEEGINNISKIDLPVTISGDKATPKLNVSDLVKRIEEINKQAKVLNDSLKELNPNAKETKVELALNLGTVDAKSAEVPLAKELLQAAKSNGIDTIGVVVNGLKMTFSSDEFKGDTKLDITKVDNASATSATDLPIASDVYEFEFTTEGHQVATFKTPLKLSIPVPNAEKFDKELLTLAKIVDGKLIYYVGKYKDGHVDGSRNSLSTYTIVENKINFNDTSSVQAWAGRQIQVAAAKGILEGRGNQVFVPNGQVTRAEFAKMIVKTFSLEDTSATDSFSDVNDSDWYKVCVASAVKNGIVNGRAEGKFDPNGQITRAEMATMAARALLLTGSTANVANVEAALQGFQDASSIDASLKSGVALAASQGIIVGEEGSQFNPNANSTRAQAAVVIYRLLNK